MSWASKLSKPYRIDDGKKFRLKDFDPRTTGQVHSKRHAEELLTQSIAEMADLQDKLYAQDRWAVLLIFQAMDAAGKDGAIKHVMSGVNPQGCQVYSFKAPTSEDLNHDFLWRTSKVLPERGHIGIFNRSYYEEVLVVRVHPKILGNERIPEELIGKDIWEKRFQDIENFERYLSHNGIVVRKFFLNVSKAEETIAATSTKNSPWYVVPADNKWYTRLVVAAAIVDTLKDLNVAYPEVEPEKRKQLEEARKELEKKK